MSGVGGYYVYLKLRKFGGGGDEGFSGVEPDIQVGYYTSMGYFYQYRCAEKHTYI